MLYLMYEYFLNLKQNHNNFTKFLLISITYTFKNNSVSDESFEFKSISEHNDVVVWNFPQPEVFEYLKASNFQMVLLESNTLFEDFRSRDFLTSFILAPTADLNKSQYSPSGLQLPWIKIRSGFCTSTRSTW